jgi:hypothetical protein
VKQTRSGSWWESLECPVGPLESVALQFHYVSCFERLVVDYSVHVTEQIELVIDRLGLHKDCELCRVRVLTLIAALNSHYSREDSVTRAARRNEVQDRGAVDNHITD